MVTDCVAGLARAILVPKEIRIMPLAKQHHCRIRGSDPRHTSSVHSSTRSTNDEQQASEDRSTSTSTATLSDFYEALARESARICGSVAISTALERMPVLKTKLGRHGPLHRSRPTLLVSFE